MSVDATPRDFSDFALPAPLLRALQENLNKYEEKFGEVRTPSDTGFEAPDRTLGFKH